jgi:hypothetical protein
MLDMRAMLSLCQYLALQDAACLRVLLEKQHMSEKFDELLDWHGRVFPALRATLSEAPSNQIHSLLAEIARTEDYLRSLATQGWEDVGYRGRWEDLTYCLELIGYRVKDRKLVAVDPTIEGAIPIDDDLSAELRQSGLSEAEEILRMMENSGQAFKKVPPDCNACLNDARVALQTLATTIATARRTRHPATFNVTKWGQVLAYLRTSHFITENEEKAIAGVFTFLSPGSHIPTRLGLTQHEMARLGRSLSASMCYFLIKLHNGNQ